jgi:hypothetical protein
MRWQGSQHAPLRTRHCRWSPPCCRIAGNLRQYATGEARIRNHIRLALPVLLDSFSHLMVKRVPAPVFLPGHEFSSCLVSLYFGHIISSHGDAFEVVCFKVKKMLSCKTQVMQLFF